MNSFILWCYLTRHYLFLQYAKIQGGSNMTGTNCDLFTHKSSRSYLNHLVCVLQIFRTQPYSYIKNARSLLTVDNQTYVYTSSSFMHEPTSAHVLLLLLLVIKGTCSWMHIYWFMHEWRVYLDERCVTHKSLYSIFSQTDSYNNILKFDSPFAEHPV